MLLLETKYPKVEWKETTGFRNVLIHDYLIIPHNLYLFDISIIYIVPVIAKFAKSKLKQSHTLLPKLLLLYLN
jgi:uncharacterized protein with HEPN domain